MRPIVALLGLVVAVIATSPNRTDALSPLSLSPASFHCPNVSIPTVTKTLWVTAYSSTPDQTDDTPFITASGKRVRKGIVAINGLPFGTRIKIPDLFGDKVFVVEDRMHRRKKQNIDVWMPTREQALEFGRQKAVIEILDPI